MPKRLIALPILALLAGLLVRVALLLLTGLLVRVALVLLARLILTTLLLAGLLLAALLLLVAVRVLLVHGFSLLGVSRRRRKTRPRNRSFRLRRVYCVNCG
jgi:hypothetical protein